MFERAKPGYNKTQMEFALVFCQKFPRAYKELRLQPGFRLPSRERIRRTQTFIRKAVAEGRDVSDKYTEKAIEYALKEEMSTKVVHQHMEDVIAAVAQSGNQEEDIVKEEEEVHLEPCEPEAQTFQGPVTFVDENGVAYLAAEDLYREGYSIEYVDDHDAVTEVYAAAANATKPEVFHISSADQIDATYHQIVSNSHGYSTVDQSVLQLPSNPPDYTFEVIGHSPYKGGPFEKGKC